MQSSTTNKTMAADLPLTINVGGEVFMISIATLQTIPHTLLANLAKYYLDILGGSHKPLSTNFTHSVDPPDEKVFDGESSADPKKKTNCPVFAQRSRFIYFITDDEDAFSNAIRSNKTYKKYAQHPSVYYPRHLTQQATKGGPTIFVDRTPVLMPYILDAYRLGELHLPTNVCSLVIRTELKFWGISEDLISACCWKNFDEGLGNLRIINTILKSLDNPYDSKKARDELSTLGRVWLIMERPSYSRLAQAWAFIYFSFIFLSMLVFSVGSLPSNRIIHPSFKNMRDAIINDGNKNASLVRMMSFTAQTQSISTINLTIDVFFTIEFLIRLMTCPSKKKFVRNVHNVIDMIILYITWTNFFLDLYYTNNTDAYGETQSYVSVIFSCMVVVRVFRVAHLGKHIPALKLMYLSTLESASELILLFIVVGSTVLFFGTMVFLFETFDKMPTDKVPFRHVPFSMWWALITMTTIGYGDIVPTTTQGYIVGVICAVSGLLIIAMPIAIVATNFSSYYYNMTSRDHCVRQQAHMESNDLKLPSVCDQVGHLDDGLIKEVEKEREFLSIKQKGSLYLQQQQEETNNIINKPTTDLVRVESAVDAEYKSTHHSKRSSKTSLIDTVEKSKDKKGISPQQRKGDSTEIDKKITTNTTNSDKGSVKNSDKASNKPRESTVDLRKDTKSEELKIQDLDAF